jgi:hypothetical protein
MSPMEMPYIPPEVFSYILHLNTLKIKNRKEKIKNNLEKRKLRIKREKLEELELSKQQYTFILEKGLHHGIIYQPLSSQVNVIV